MDVIAAGSAPGDQHQRGAGIDAFAAIYDQSFLSSWSISSTNEGENIDRRTLFDLIPQRL